MRDCVPYIVNKQSVTTYNDFLNIISPDPIKRISLINGASAIFLSFNIRKAKMKKKIVENIQHHKYLLGKTIIILFVYNKAHISMQGAFKVCICIIYWLLFIKIKKKPNTLPGPVHVVCVL